VSTVLLLDDDKDLRALLRSALTSHGVEVVEAASGREADTVLGRTSADLVVVDGLLPDGPGLGFIERLRGRDPRVRIVFVSAFFRDMKTFRRLTTELDVSLVLYKPLDALSFAAKVVELIAAQGGDAAGADAATQDAGAAFAAEMAELRRAFAARLPQKLEQLTQAIADARSDLSRIAAARTLAHRLRGSAGSYGCAATGNAVGVIEDLLVELERPGMTDSWDEVDRALADARLAAAAPSDATGVAGESSLALTKPLLVVDDDPDFLQMVTTTARKLLIEVVTAQSRDEALVRARAKPLLAAILDVHMDEDDSFQLARQIRETRGNAEVAIAFASVDRTIATRVAAIEAGGSRFFEKPITAEAFASLVPQFLSQTHGQRARVLIVDDDEDALAHYSRHLRAAGMLVEQLTSTDTLIDKLEEARPDVLLLDVNLPRVSGIDVCRALRMSDRWELLPILIVTAQTDADTRLRSFRAGASDVIAKPVLPEELMARVGVQEKHMRLLRERADKDSLSGLLLRRALLEAFQRAISGCAREGKPLSLVLLDIDHFKHVNDTYGHIAGDQVIARLGELLRRRFRVEDLRARWGGEEFLLVFPGQTAEFAVEAAERLLLSFGSLEFSAEGHPPFNVSFTAGVAEYPGDGSSISSLLRRADERLYEGKKAGRNRVSTSPPGRGSMPPPPSRRRK
jgi:diguanylate cyclase (GGDEF)-like protein